MLPYFDAHCDTIAAISHQGGSLAANAYHVDLARLETYAPRAQVFAPVSYTHLACTSSQASPESLIP